MPRALILESYAPTRQAMASILQREGWDVTLSQTSQEALGCLLKQAYDILLVDLEMSTGDGWRVLEQLVSDATSMPILAMIDRDSHVFQTQVDLSASVILLHKPLRRDCLLASAATALQSRGL